MMNRIVINQTAVIEAGLIGKIDVKDLFLLDYVDQLKDDSEADKATEGGKRFVRVSYFKASQNLPVIDMKAESLRNRFRTLVRRGLLLTVERSLNDNRGGWYALSDIAKGVV